MKILDTMWHYVEDKIDNGDIEFIHTIFAKSKHIFQQ